MTPGQPDRSPQYFIVIILPFSREQTVPPVESLG